MGHYTYTELAKSRFFIKDTIIKRWIEFSIDTYLQGNTSAITALFYGLHMHEKVPERDTGLMARFRDIAETIFDPMECIYCGDELTSFEMDHFIPWSKLPVNRFWNLFPSCSSCNSNKTDKIVEMEDKVTRRIRMFLNRWLDYFDKNRDQLRPLGGSQVEHLQEKSRDEQIELLVEQIKEINQNLL